MREQRRLILLSGTPARTGFFGVWGKISLPAGDHCVNHEECEAVNIKKTFPHTIPVILITRISVSERFFWVRLRN
jgi:hypothetical protein